MEIQRLNSFNELPGDLIKYIVSLLDEKSLFLFCIVSKETRYHILANVDFFLPIISNQNCSKSIDPTIQPFLEEFESLLAKMNQLYTEKYGALLSSGPFNETNGAFLFNSIGLRCRQLSYSNCLCFADTKKITPEIMKGLGFSIEQGHVKTVFIIVRYDPVSLKIHTFWLASESKLAGCIIRYSRMPGKTITFYSPLMRDEYRRILSLLDKETAFHSPNIRPAREEKKKFFFRISHMLWLEENPSIISSIKRELDQL